jgi:hypothetical protein
MKAKVRYATAHEKILTARVPAVADEALGGGKAVSCACTGSPLRSGPEMRRR